MGSKLKFLGIGVLAGVLLMAIPAGYMTGKLKGAESNNRVLMNLACSLEETEFQERLSALTPPTDFKEVVGEEYQQAWELVKEQLYYQCYG